MYKQPKITDSQDFYVTYMTRETGRTSNQLYEYVFWALKAACDRKFFKSFYTFPEPFDKALPERFDYDKKIEFDWKPFPVGAPYSVKYYMDHRSYIRSTLFKIEEPKVIESGKILVIHLRLDDIDTAGCYTPLTIRYYENLFKDVKFNGFSKIYIVGNPINEQQVTFIENVTELIPIKIEPHKTQSVSEDFKIIMSATTLITSCSTFWFWPMFMGTSIKELLVPDTDFINSIVDKDIYEKNGINLRFVKV